MKNASQWALVSGALVLGIAYACATPVEIHDCPLGANTADCDVLLYQPGDFELADASVPIGAGGSEVSRSGGSAGTNQTPPSGAAGTGSPPSGGSAGQGVAGSGQSAGAGGASGGTAGSGAGTGGVAGTAGSAGTTGAGGTTAQSNFNPAACNFTNRAGCETKACLAACPTGMGNYCSSNCESIITCVAAAPACITAQDPMCGTPSQNPFTPNTCTPIVNSSGSPTTSGTPAFAALALMNCLCDDTRL